MLHRARLPIAALIAVMLLAVALPGAIAGAQSQEAAVSVASDKRVDPGAESFKVNIDAQDVSDLAGFQFTLNVDPKVLKPVSVDKTAFLAQTGREVVCRDAQIAADSVSYACVTLRDQPEGAKGDGTLAVVTMKPLVKGASALKLSNVKLVHRDGSELPIRTSDGTIKIAEASSNWPMIALIAGVAAAVVLIAGGAAWFARRRSRRVVSTGPVDFGSGDLDSGDA